MERRRDFSNSSSNSNSSSGGNSGGRNGGVGGAGNGGNSSSGVKKRSGQHAALRKRKTEYGLQLMNKQEMKDYFGLKDRSLRLYYEKAKVKHGNILDILCCFLCSRLDYVVFVTGICPTISSAKQLISHGHVLVNGKRVDKRSYPLKADDEVSFTPSMKNFTASVNNLAKRKHDHIPYLSAENIAHIHEVKIKFLSTPAFANAIIPNKDKLKSVVEFYSK